MMPELKEKLVKIIDAIDDIKILEYLYYFISRKFGMEVQESGTEEGVN